MGSGADASQTAGMWGAKLALDAAITVAPLAGWGLAGVVSFALTGEARLVLVTTTWWRPPLFSAGMAATRVTTGFGVTTV